MAVLPAAQFDTFSRSGTDTWGTTDSGVDWLGETSNFDTFYSAGSYGYGRINVPTSVTSYTNVVYLDVSDSDDQEVLFRMKHSTSNLTDYGPVLRYSNSNTFYFARIQQWYDEIAIVCSYSGTLSERNRTSFTLGADAYHWVRFKVDDTGCYLKVWDDGDAEPGSWSLTGTLHGSGPSDGGVGIYSRKGNSTYTVSVDQMYYYDGTEATPSMPVDDTFSRVVHTGLGMADTDHIWYGEAGSTQPESYNETFRGQIDSGDGYAEIALSSGGQTEARAVIGPDEQDVEGYMKIYCSSTTGNPAARVGVRMNASNTSGNFAWDDGGYYARLRWGLTTNALEIYDSDVNQLGTYTLGTAAGAGETWHIRMYAENTGTVTVKAKAWKDGTSEPAWQIDTTDATNVTASGQGGFRLSNSNATEAIFRIEDFEYTYISSGNRLTTGSVTSSSVTDTSMVITATYTNDDDEDSTCAVQYRKVGDTSFTTATTPTADRTAHDFETTITGLDEGTQYEIKTTYTDADGVIGTNPKTIFVTTALTGTDTHDLVLTSDATDEIDIVAQYTNDSDDDSTAAYRYRSFGTVTTHATDTFVDIAATNIANHTTDDGQTWIQHASVAGSFEINPSGKLVPAATLGGRHCAYVNNAPSSADYEVGATLCVDGDMGEATVALRIVSGADSRYYAGWRDSNGGQYVISKIVSGTYTNLASVDAPLASGSEVDIIFRVVGTSLMLFVDNVLTLHTTDSSLSSAGYGGVSAYSADGTDVLLDNFYIKEYSSASAWSGSTALSTKVLGSPYNHRSGTITSLSADTTYEIEVTFTDADGVRGLNPLVETITTQGVAARFSSTPITVAATETSAVVSVYYDFDTNDNSSVAIQYKSIREDLWKTVNSSAITVDRLANSFVIVLSGLSPNLSYEVQATLSDPNGLVAGTNSTESAIFTTSGTIIDPDIRGKHYLVKTYDSDGNYLSTWNDAPEPSFRWYENGGVSDLTISLPRTLARVNQDSSIDFGNRVDVWAIDETSDGLGPNMIKDWDMELGSWTLTTSWSVASEDGPDSGSALTFDSGVTTTRQVLSENISMTFVVPVVVKAIAKARGGKLRMDIAAYDSEDSLLDTSDTNAETVGNLWQEIKMEWVPPADTSYIRVRMENVGKGTMTFDKVTVLPKELLIYRGYIEAYTPKVSASGEEVDVDVYSIATQISDYYVDFLQFVENQPSVDVTEHPNQNADPDDPANMMKAIVDLIVAENPRAALYYTSDSIKLTGTVAEYTFKEIRGDDAFDKVRTLCPPGWHWFLDPDGRVNLRGPEHATTHKVRLNVEIMEFENERSINNLKNFVIVRGRRDSNASEPDGYGTIEYIAFDQASIDLYGKRVLFIRDQNVIDPDTAAIVGDGRLEENNNVEENVVAQIPDDKSLRYTGGSLKGYNIEAFKPGDNISIYDPISGLQRSYWDFMVWDVDTWDDKGSRLLPSDVPIKTIRYEAEEVTLELSERQPSSTGDYAKLVRWLRQQEQQNSNDN